MQRKIFIIIIFLILFAILGTILSIKFNNTKDNQLYSPVINASYIANYNNKSEYYGKIVTNYSCPNNSAINSWKIFYATEDNIYLIADDYISYYYCPSSLTQTITKNSEFSLSMNDVIRDYDGSTNITNKKIQKLNSSYFDTLSIYSSSNNNIKAVAYMLDTQIWNGFSGEKAEYAIGGPSLEMFLKSYNQKYNVDFQVKSNELGYRISLNGGLNWDASTTPILNTNDSLYIKPSSNKAYRMWLSSPSCWSSSCVMCVSYTGSIELDNFDSSLQGFRPLVCLNSNVCLEKQNDGTYLIK